MRNDDLRSRRIAVVSERLLNAHLQGSAEERAVMRALEDEGYGLIQLPPEDAPPEAMEAAIGFAVDQVQDYLKNAYEVVNAAATQGRVEEGFLAACGSRGIDLRRYARGNSG
jgi:hypothetical protein